MDDFDPPLDRRPDDVFLLPRLRPLDCPPLACRAEPLVLRVAWLPDLLAFFVEPRVAFRPDLVPVPVAFLAEPAVLPVAFPAEPDALPAAFPAAFPADPAALPAVLPAAFPAELAAFPAVLPVFSTV